MFSVRFHFLFCTAVTISAKKPLYGRIGDEAVLTPDSVVNPITSIEWKHGPDLAMERYGGKTFSYRHFKDRGMLNILTGELTITGLTSDDSGNYTVEINNKVTSKTQLLVISPVSKPTLSLWCEPEMTYCVLTCNGNTTGVEPVTYRWTSGDIMWPSTQEHNITKKDKEPWFSCALKNPVSFNSSEKVFNPFISDQTRMYISIPIFVVFLVVCVIIIIIILIYKCRKGQADERTRQEREELLPIQDTSTQDQTSVVTQDTHNGTERSTTSPDVPETSTQDPTSVVTQDTSNGTERPASLVVVQETSPQDTTSTGPPETSKETERSTTSPDVPETSTQDQENAVSQDTSNGTERSTTSPDVPETSTQDQENAVSQDTSNETEREVLLPIQDKSTQDPTSVVVQDTHNGTERSTTSPDVPETSTQDQENAVSQDTSNETERSTTSPDVPETSTQDQETAESPDPSNETEKSAMITDDLETRC